MIHFILIALLLGSTVANTAPTADSTWTDKNILALIDTTIARQSNLISLSCRSHQTRQVGTAAPSLFEGTVDYQSPNRLLLHYYTPAEEIYAANDSFFLFFSFSQNTGARFRRTGIHPLEKQIMDQMGQVRRNTLSTMRNDYFFTFVRLLGDSDVVISATPKSGWKALSAILIKINRKYVALTALELYDKNGALISQTQYSGFIPVIGTQAYFPKRSVVQTVSGESIENLVTDYTRLKFNPVFEPTHFYPVLPKNAVLEEPPSEK
ncbi:MAG: hypothetical protein A2293_14480 [Elusimicrobia bacterium RIFOXYB2_FULL_49_7]|nr:MAG: hypothetical protein A2293_14480 [Elusimicrobia bacterium RIFOXYB2_FULL_49_7]